MGDFDGVNIERLLSASLKVMANSHTYLSNNIANAETPGFKPSHVNFVESLKQMISAQEGDTNSSRSLPSLVFDEEASALRNDLSGIDIERELALMEKNSVAYTVAAALLAKRYQGIKQVLRNLR